MNKSEKKSPDIGLRKDSITTGIRADSITTGIRAESGMTMKKPDSIFAGDSDIRTKTTATDILKTPCEI